MPHEKYSYVAVLHRFYLMWNHLLENTRFGICVISRVLPFLKSEVGPHLWDPWFKIFTTLARVCLAFTKRLYHSTSTWFWCSLHIRALVGSFSLWCFLSSSMHYMKSFTCLKEIVCSPSLVSFTFVRGSSIFYEGVYPTHFAIYIFYLPRGGPLFLLSTRRARDVDALRSRPITLVPRSGSQRDHCCIVISVHS